MTTSTVKITADVAEFVRNIKTAEGQMHMLDRGAGMLRTGVVALASSFAAAAGINGISSLITRSMQLRDEQAKLADRLGITTEEVAALSLQAELTGIGADKLETALQKMVVRLQDAAVKGGPAADAVEKLGVNIFELASKSPDQAFFAISDAMQNVTSANERLNIVADIFGEKNSAILAMLDEGREGFDAAAEATRNFGTAISRVDAAKIEAANDAFTKASESVDGLATRVSIRLSPILQQLADNFATNTANLARFLGFRTEEEELNHLYEERKNIIEHLMRLDAVKSDDPVARQRLVQVREEIGAIVQRQQAAQNEAAERERQQAAEEIALQKKLEAAAKEKTADEEKIARIKREQQAWRDLQDERDEINAGYSAWQQENAEGEQATLDMKLAGMHDYEANLRQITQVMAEEAAKQAELERMAADSKMAMQESVAGNAISLMQMLGGKNKNWAKAAVILDKAMSIAKIKMATEVAAMNAAAAAAVGGPGAALAAANSMRAMGYASMAMVAAMGALELSNINTGGGSSASGASTGGASGLSPYGAPPAVIPTQQQASGSITINVNGVITDDIVNNLIVPAIQDSVENRDVILIRSDSRNGQILMPA